ncbi:MAG: transglutaminase domain-containing protein, partial [Christensenellales bacterium]
IGVSTSNQLVYVLEKGFKPVPVGGSRAESVYNKAKAVLREICDDTMTDFEKAKAIYDWLVLNVQYDKVAANTDSISQNWTSYDAWYPEGVFNNHKAVCDGIARSFLILARIENIASIRVSGYHNGGGHAWNKVYIDGNWYGVDATHGNPDIGGEYEILTYTSFLFTDEYKQTCCTFEIKAGTNTQSTPLNVFAKMSFGSDSSSFDLYINSTSELNRLVAFVKAYVPDENYYQGSTNHDYFTIQLAIAQGSGVTINLVCAKLGVYSYVQEVANGNISTYTFVIAF